MDPSKSIIEALTESPNLELEAGIFDVKDVISLDLEQENITIYGKQTILFSGKVVSYVKNDRRTTFTVTDLPNIGRITNAFFQVGSQIMPIIHNNKDSIIVLGSYEVQDFSEYKIYELSSILNFQNIQLYNGSIQFNNVVLRGAVTFENCNLNTKDCYIQSDSFTLKNSKWTSVKLSIANSFLYLKKTKIDWMMSKLINTKITCNYSKINIILLIGRRSDLILGGGKMYIKNSNDTNVKLDKLATANIKNCNLNCMLVNGSRMYAEKSCITKDVDETSLCISKLEASNLEFSHMSILSKIM